MFKNTFQSGFLSILYSIGSKPLQIWDKQGKPGMQQRAIGCLTGPTLTCLFPGLDGAFEVARPRQRVCEALGTPLPMAQLTKLSLGSPIRNTQLWQYLWPCLLRLQRCDAQPGMSCTACMARTSMHSSTKSLLSVGLSTLFMQHCALSASSAGRRAAARSLSLQMALVFATTNKALPSALHRGLLHPHRSAAAP